MSRKDSEPFVWIFNGSRSRFPSGAFLERTRAEEWIGVHRLTGTLSRYPLGVGTYDWAVEKKHFKPTKDKHRTPEFIGRFSAGFEHYHYVEGKRET